MKAIYEIDATGTERLVRDGTDGNEPIVVTKRTLAFWTERVAEMNARGGSTRYELR